ncbi:MAG: Na+/H+ antiporter NhaC family protein [Clostridiales bacterium]
MIFNLPPIFALVPLVLYIVLAFKDINAVLNVVICVILSAIMTQHSLLEMGGVIAGSLGSFLGMIGFIIMLGSALGAVLRKTGVAEHIVMALTNKIGIDTEKKAILSCMACSILLVSMLGTLAGANAIIAPIVIPLVAAIGITPSTLAAVLFGSGITGLFIGPYAPPVVTYMEITGLPYGTYLIGVGLPVAILLWVVTFFMALRIQKKTKGVYSYDNVEKPRQNYMAAKETKRATLTFALALAVMIIWGMFLKYGSSFAIVVIFTVAVLTGLTGGQKPSELFETMMEGAGRMVWLFVMFVLFDPFIYFVSEAGAFEALVGYLQPLLQSNSKVLFTFIASMTGIFGIGGAAVAQAVVMDNMFGSLAHGLGLSPTLWGCLILIGSQITSFAYPEADMLGQMGLARSKDLKNMVKFGLTITAASVIFLVVRSFFG